MQTNEPRFVSSWRSWRRGRHPHLEEVTHGRRHEKAQAQGLAGTKRRSNLMAGRTYMYIHMIRERRDAVRDRSLVCWQESGGCITVSDLDLGDSGDLVENPKWKDCSPGYSQATS